MSKRRNGKKVSSARKKRAGRQAARRANIRYKDTVFRMLFKDKKRLLGLYNAVSGKDYTDSEKLEVVTLESAVYMGMKNDLAFLIDFNLYLFEHQSTINNNMPLRFLQYVAAEYEKLTVSNNLHGRKLVQIPAPHFVVFYNGVEAYKEWQELRLSDAFQIPEKEPELELRVRVLNINEGFHEELKSQCQTLGEYMQYVGKVRTYAKEMPLDKAIDKAVDECIAEGILREFLLQNKAEVKRMSIYEYDEEATRQNIREYAYECGVADGEARVNQLALLLAEAGRVTDFLKSLSASRWCKNRKGIPS